MMITRNFIGVLALCLCALAACTSSKESKKTLTVLSWNVWHGGHSKTYSGKGCEGTIDILKKSEADVVLMIETYGAAPTVLRQICSFSFLRFSLRHALPAFLLWLPALLPFLHFSYPLFHVPYAVFLHISVPF